jgi:hypothetical protein
MVCDQLLEPARDNNRFCEQAHMDCSLAMHPLASAKVLRKTETGVAMVLSSHRLTLAGILLAMVAAVGLPVLALAAPDAGPAPTAQSSIVARALQDVDTWQGECWSWMKKVVQDATGKSMGYDYRQGYFDAGAIEVNPAQAGPGDIIQIVRDSDSSPSADYPGMHSAIVLSNHGDGTFTVIDSNANWDGMVHIRDDYSPSDRAAANGIQYHVYRFPGQGLPVTPLAPPAPPKPFAAGDRAIVKLGTGGLNLRPTPSTTQAPIGLLADGTAVTVISAPVTAEGRVWVKVTTPAGDGWVAVEFLDRPAAPASGTSLGAPKKLDYTRAVLPVLSADE